MKPKMTIDGIPEWIIQTTELPQNLENANDILENYRQDAAQIATDLQNADIILQSRFNDDVELWQDWKRRTSSAFKIMSTRIRIIRNWIRDFKLTERTKKMEGFADANDFDVNLKDVRVLVEEQKREIANLRSQVKHLATQQNEILRLMIDWFTDGEYSWTAGRFASAKSIYEVNNRIRQKETPERHLAEVDALEVKMRSLGKPAKGCSLKEASDGNEVYRQDDHSSQNT